MDNIDDISSIVGKFRKVAEVKDYAEKLFIQLKVATETIQKQQQEIAHLKQLLDGVVVSKIAPHNIAPEQLICEMEILRIQKVVETRALSLEETKRFDVLVNDLLAIKKSQNENKEDDHSIELSDEAQLLQLVKNDGRENK